MTIRLGLARRWAGRLGAVERAASALKKRSTKKDQMSNEIPRRSRIDLFSPAEKAIYDAVQVVEAAGCDMRLTRALNKLHEARALVADFVDGVPDGEGYPRPAPPLPGGTEGEKR